MVRISFSVAVRAATQTEELLKRNNSLLTREPVVPAAGSMPAEAQDCVEIAVPGPCSQLACSQ